MHSKLLDNPFILAPMAGITDMPFRRLMKRLGAGCVISEFVSAHGIVSTRRSSRASQRMREYLAFHEDERPVGIQIFGGDVGVLCEAAEIVQDLGVDFVDVNLGCPVPKVTKKGGGSAWLCRTSELGAMFASLKRVLHIPLTIKIRSGWDLSTLNANEIMGIAKNEGVHWVALHARTRAQGYSGFADWELIQNLSTQKDRPHLIGNGDITTGAVAVARLLLSGVEGVMIGRGALKNPWIFMEAQETLKATEAFSLSEKNLLSQQILREHRLPPFADSDDTVTDYYVRRVKSKQPLPIDFSAKFIRIRSDRDPLWLLNTHISLLRELYPEQKVFFNLRKFLAWYAAGYPGAHEFRKFIFTTQDFNAVLEKTLEFFETVKGLGEKEREQSPVLMSGHG